MGVRDGFKPASSATRRGRPLPMARPSSERALAIAQSSTPAALANEPFQDDHGIPLGSRVAVAAESFGLEPTEGELVAATHPVLA